ncbi:hypothetical protein H0H93_003450 [Arthromyces matolae]|nr:hypothetical protein H0H93_003450 [Arthromyces matolae]
MVEVEAEADHDHQHSHLKAAASYYYSSTHSSTGSVSVSVSSSNHSHSHSRYQQGAAPLGSLLSPRSTCTTSPSLPPGNPPSASISIPTNPLPFPKASESKTDPGARISSKVINPAPPPLSAAAGDDDSRLTREGVWCRCIAPPAKGVAAVVAAAMRRSIAIANLQPMEPPLASVKGEWEIRGLGGLMFYLHLFYLVTDQSNAHSHLNIGAGRVVWQDIVGIDLSIKKRQFHKNPTNLESFKRAKEGNGRLHLLGLISDDGVHSHISHLFALLKTAKEVVVPKTYIHLFGDGRDTAPRSAAGYCQQLLDFLKKENYGELTTIIAVDGLVKGEGEDGKGKEGVVDVIKANYEKDVTDEFLKPIIVNGKEGRIQDTPLSTSPHHLPIPIPFFVCLGETEEEDSGYSELLTEFPCSSFMFCFGAGSSGPAFADDTHTPLLTAIAVPVAKHDMNRIPVLHSKSLSMFTFLLFPILVRQV